MKTIRELYDEVMANPEMKDSFVEAAKAEKLEAFLKEHGCEATMNEVAAFLKAKAEEDVPLSMDELENSAGGACNKTTVKEAALSVLSAGVFCAVIAGVSGGMAKGLGTHHVGQQNDNECRLCEENPRR